MNSQFFVVPGMYRRMVILDGRIAIAVALSSSGTVR